MRWVDATNGLGGIFAASQRWSNLSDARESDYGKLYQSRNDENRLPMRSALLLRCALIVQYYWVFMLFWLTSIHTKLLRKAHASPRRAVKR
jgi:hypothetical protein